MECIRCGNKDPTYFYNGSKGYYCRKCVKFKRILLDDDIQSKEYDVNSFSYDYNFDYPLTKYQDKVSKETLKCLNEHFDVLLYCICGAGKTEIVVESISDFLKRGLKVCYAISRREVVIELEKRFKTIFKNATVTSVYGGHHDRLDGDLIICTTHQLFRYYKTFDLLILDEVDAFPLSGNETLMNISINSCKGNIVYSTATLNSFIKKYLEKREYKEVNLYVRPSLKPLIVPKVLYGFNILNYLKLYLLLKKTNNQNIIFCSSINLCKRLYLFFRRIFNCTYVYSDLDKRKNNIFDFKTKKYKFIFSTSVLERGITIKNVDVIIIFDRKNAFSKESIIQMSGRVGRNYKNPYGNCTILTSKISKEIKEAIDEIKDANMKYELSLLR